MIGKALKHVTDAQERVGRFLDGTEEVNQESLMALNADLATALTELEKESTDATGPMTGRMSSRLRNPTMGM